MIIKIFFLVLVFFSLHAQSEEALTSDQVSSSATPPAEINQKSIKQYSVCNSLVLYKKTNFFSTLNNSLLTQKFYTQYCKHLQNFAWFDSTLQYSPQALDLLASIDDSLHYGLNPEKYHQNELASDRDLLENGTFSSDEKKIALMNTIDLLLTDAYITMAEDLYYGFTDWEKFKTSKIADEQIEWDRPTKLPLLVTKRLFDSLKKNSIKSSLETLNPDFKEYTRLIKALAYYRSLEKDDEWVKIPFGSLIILNSTDERLPLIKKRLLESGELDTITDPDGTLYDDKILISAVKKFQSRHNLSADGLIGNKTIVAMNVPLSKKITTIILNLERYRWLNSGMDKTDAYIDINVPAFTMQLLEKGDELFHMNVIVGTKDRPTPILSSKISYAVINPTWTAPQTIVKEDILEKKNLLKYLQKHNMRVYRQIHGEMIEQNPRAINWEPYKEAGAAPFTFKADAGKSNPLGVVKFIFPNKYSIYMHDTNSRGLFKNEYRALSSGCIRLGEPKKLLTYLSPKEDIISGEIEDEHRVDLQKRLPVLIRYMTVGVDSDQKVYFYNDIYGYDDLQLQNIKKINFMKFDTMN